MYLFPVRADNIFLQYSFENEINWYIFSPENIIVETDEG